MSNLNIITLSGFVATEPEVKTYGDNKKLLKFRIGVNQSVKNKLGDWENKSSFFNVVKFGANYYEIDVCKKGSVVFLSGSLSEDSYEKATGEKVRFIQITANFLDFYDLQKKGLKEIKNDEVGIDDLPF